MRRYALLVALLCTAVLTAFGQHKLRPDAFPPRVSGKTVFVKSGDVATSAEQMAGWNKYPSYGLYVEMMRQWESNFPSLCRIDTIGTSINGRLLLSAELTANPTDTSLPEFFYSSSIHGDELTGYVMLLRLIDTLLLGYGSNSQYTQLLRTTRICINPLANPDGTYAAGDDDISLAMRFNADYCDLNRNFPNPFVAAKEALQPENEAMIAYVSRHRFRLSANLHDGSEVMNYPWDSFTSAQLSHPDATWWQAVCKRFVDTARRYYAQQFIDVCDDGYIAGGDWYVITGGRQDYMNYYHHCLELTMEISAVKTPAASQLPNYWYRLQHALVNYIAEVHSLPTSAVPPAPSVAASSRFAYPNPAISMFTLSAPLAMGSWLCTLDGRKVRFFPQGAQTIDVAELPAGVYLLSDGNGQALKLQVLKP
ncbi:MAG: succinylglutamate desuccinylase/aspartoacylase family protein [Bacteroidales bacterium]|nr:succinylglutamate desuccinylase/aspartoacylase family protein [Bacteroidales bacterium]